MPERSADEVCAIYGRSQTLNRRVHNAQSEVLAAQDREVEHQQYAGQMLKRAQKACSEHKTNTGCTGIPVPVQVSYPGIQIASFFMIAGLHTVMLGSLVTLIKLVYLARSIC